MKSGDNKVELYESEQFLADIAKHLNKNEQSALHHYLVNSPTAGVPMEGVPEIMLLEWNKSQPIQIAYVIGEHGRQIRLIAVLDPADSPLDEHELGAVNVLVKALKRFGIGLGMKALWELIKGGL